MRQLFYSLFLVALSLTSAASKAETLYVSDYQRITVRQGPSTSEKILTAVGSDTPVEVLKKGEEWSKVKTQSGIEGWSLTRGLSDVTPARVQLKKAQEQIDKLKERLSSSKDDKNQVYEENETLKNQLAEKEKALTQVSDELKQLQEVSQNVVKLQKDYKATLLQLNDYYVKNEKLEARMNNHLLYWFLAGAGVLVLGMLIGRVQKRPQYGNQTLRF